jgi:hypothetical protein
MSPIQRFFNEIKKSLHIHKFTTIQQLFEDLVEYLRTNDQKAGCRKYLSQDEKYYEYALKKQPF